MKQVTKVVMYVWRMHQDKPEFFVLHRHRGDCVVLTGHVGDHLPEETLAEAAKREVQEELGVLPLQLEDLQVQAEVYLPQWDKRSTEHAFLIEIPDQDVRFLEGDESHRWCAFTQLAGALSYDNQKKALPKIQERLTSLSSEKK